MTLLKIFGLKDKPVQSIKASDKLVAKMGQSFVDQVNKFPEIAAAGKKLKAELDLTCDTLFIKGKYKEKGQKKIKFDTTLNEGKADSDRLSNTPESVKTRILELIRPKKQA